MGLASDTSLLASLDNGDKLRMLINLACNLTIVARDTYSEAGVADAGGLRSLDEIQHRVLGKLRSLATDSEAGLPDDALAMMFFTRRDDVALSSLLAYAFERAARTVCRANPTQ